MKGSFTRTYNKSSCPLPYATASMSKKKRKQRQGADDDDVMGINEEDATDAAAAAAADTEPSDDDDVAADSMIKVTFLIFLPPVLAEALCFWFKVYWCV